MTLLRFRWFATPFVDMILSAPEPPTTTPGVDAPGAEPDVATAAPPALPLLSSPSTIVVASQGPVPVVVALPATGPVTGIPLVSASLLVAVGVMAVLAARRQRTRSV